MAYGCPKNPGSSCNCPENSPTPESMALASAAEPNSGNALLRPASGEVIITSKLSSIPPVTGNGLLRRSPRIEVFGRESLPFVRSVSEPSTLRSVTERGMPSLFEERPGRTIVGVPTRARSVVEESHPGRTIVVLPEESRAKSVFEDEEDVLEPISASTTLGCNCQGSAYCDFPDECCPYIIREKYVHQTGDPKITKTDRNTFLLESSFEMIVNVCVPLKCTDTTLDCPSARVGWIQVCREAYEMVTFVSSKGERKCSISFIPPSGITTIDKKPNATTPLYDGRPSIPLEYIIGPGDCADVVFSDHPSSEFYSEFEAPGFLGLSKKTWYSEKIDGYKDFTLYLVAQCIDCQDPCDWYTLGYVLWSVNYHYQRPNIKADVWTGSGGTNIQAEYFPQKYCQKLFFVKLYCNKKGCGEVSSENKHLFIDCERAKNILRDNKIFIPEFQLRGIGRSESSILQNRNQGLLRPL